MKNETKSIITRGSCAKSLIDEALALLPMGIVGVLLCIPFVLLTLWAFHDAPALYAWFFAALAAACVGYFVYYLVVNLLLHIVLVKRGSFAIVEDTLVTITEEERIRAHGNHFHVRREKVFYFENHGRHVVTGSVFEYSSVGDRFYVVISTGKRPRILQVYHTRIYEYHV